MTLTVDQIDDKMCQICGEEEAKHVCSRCGAFCCEACTVMPDGGDLCVTCMEDDEDGQKEGHESIPNKQGES